MGKSKGGKGAEKAGKQSPKCSCDDPYLCICGNRPERPSRGHRWDPKAQEWGGKGHKQKGGSGQISTKAAEARTTEVGKTTVAQWQQLPTTLLESITRKEGRPPPKYTSIGEYKFRVIIQDAKAARRGTEHDLILVPAEACSNEEQAREEAALLALLHLTPNIPHERKLPEPYKTTWLHAGKAVNEAKKNKLNAKPMAPVQEMNQSDIGKAKSTTNDGDCAKASINLTMGNKFVSLAERRREQDKKRQERNARIQKHEAVRMANKDHQVFLSAQIRKRIETLLRGETIQWEENSQDSDDNDEELDDDLKAYVIERLHSEGFTKSQARTSYSQLKSKIAAGIGEDQWDTIYDECLQWLCIHLDEDQLPEGFDPRGRTLDVIINQDSCKLTTQTNNSPAVQVASKYGISVAEASALLTMAESSDIDQVFWEALCSLASTALTTNQEGIDPALNLEIARDELEAIEAIFPAEECQIHRGEDGVTTVVMSLPTEDYAQKLEMKIVTNDGQYPANHVERVLIYGTWAKPAGVAVHVKLIQFLSQLPLLEPMIYQIYGCARTLLQDCADDKLQKMSLQLASIWKAKTQPDQRMQSPQETSATTFTATSRRRQGGVLFWSMLPKETPRANPFPDTDAKIRRQRESLPAAKARGDFLKAMQDCLTSGRVVLVTGDTGCGKTTQIPQFILEDSPDEAKIVVAQPRRLAATGVASRVANERGESQPGTGAVGYVVRGDVAMSKSTRLVFCTTGVLLRQLQTDGAFDAITHIIVDEVHERHLDTDVLLGILKECLSRTPHLRVILMSATLDADRFATYWGANTPRLHIPGRTFPVVDFMLEDILELTGYIPPKKGKKKSFFGGGYHMQGNPTSWQDSERSEDEETEETESISTDTTLSSGKNARVNTIPIAELVHRVDDSNVDYDMLGHLIKSLIQTKNDNGSILVFLSGAPEINKAMNVIDKLTRGVPVDLLPLHGGLQPRDQNKVFNLAPPGRTKVILSTNIAETSITIPDCTIVVDSCREKQSSFDPVNRMPLLLESFAAKASLKQRRGRAGRVQAGTCYKLISRATYDGLQEHGTPEIHRCALDQTLLSLLFLGIENGSGNFFQTLLDPPNQDSVDAATLSLQKLGAITSPDVDNQVSLTPLGIHLARIPAPPPVGKIMILGSILGCRSAALAMAAGMSVGRTPFIRVDNFARRGIGIDDTIEDMKRQRTIEARKELFRTVGNSDHALLAAAYLQWDSSVGPERRRYCDLMGLSFNGMHDMRQLVNQLHLSLTAAGYGSTEEADRNSKSWRIIRACSVAALAPSQLVRVHRPSTKYAETIGGAKEKDGEAKELAFFIQASRDDLSSNSSVSQDVLNNSTSKHYYHGVAEERVFIHPASANYTTGSFSCPWLVYHDLVRTSKPFLRDATECSAYALLLFGGKLEVQAGNGRIIVADWVRLAANARIGALIGGLRKTIDELLARKIQDPGFDIASTTEMKLVRSLLVTDGLGQ